MLPYAIEYLLTLERAGGGRLVQQGASQVIIPILPPYSQVVLTSAPWGQDFVDIGFLSVFDTGMVPMSYYAVEQHWGNRTMDGRLPGTILNNPFDTFIIISDAEPIYLRIVNMSPLNQFYAGVVFFVGVRSAGDYELVKEALRRAGTSKEQEQLAIESNRLLRRIAGEPPMMEVAP